MYPKSITSVCALAFAALFVAAPGGKLPAQPDTARLKVEITEMGQDEPLPCRIHLTARGKPVYAPDCPRWERDEDFCCSGAFVVDLPAGKVRITADRGPEWNLQTETLEIEPGETRRLSITLSRWIDMNERGWYSGDLHVHRPPDDMPLLMRAEDLNVAPVLTHWNQQHASIDPPYLKDAADRKNGKTRPRVFHLLNQEDERFGGAILMFNLEKPILRNGVYRHWPSGMAYHRAALEQAGVHIEQEKPFWWEAPVHVALGRVDSIGIVHNHFNRRGLMENEAWGRPRERDQYPGPLGFCRYTLDLYYRYLNLGWDIPASAGSASGVLANPLGYCRAYVQMDKFDEPSDYNKWFEALRAGRNFVTNGPMLFATVNDKPMGTSLRVTNGERFDATVRFEAAGRAPLDRVEIIVGGKLEKTVRADADRQSRIKGKVSIPISRSTWIAVRAFETHKPTIRFAHTSPFYVTVGGKKRRDPEAARYYVKWIDDLIAYTERERSNFKSEEHFDEVVETYRKALERYQKLTTEK